MAVIGALALILVSDLGLQLPTEVTFFNWKYHELLVYLLPMMHSDNTHSMFSCSNSSYDSDGYFCANQGTTELASALGAPSAVQTAPVHATKSVHQSEAGRAQPFKVRRLR